MARRSATPDGTRVMDDTAQEGMEFSLPAVANALGIHRVTLIRMEARGDIPKARWRRKPNPHRVYSVAEMEAVRVAIVKLHATRDKGRNFAE